MTGIWLFFKRAKQMTGNVSTQLENVSRHYLGRQQKCTSATEIQKTKISMRVLGWVTNLVSRVHFGTQVLHHTASQMLPIDTTIEVLRRDPSSNNILEQKHHSLEDESHFSEIIDASLAS